MVDHVEKTDFMTQLPKLSAQLEPLLAVSCEPRFQIDYRELVYHIN
jgi:hypothetical protein